MTDKTAADAAWRATWTKYKDTLDAAALNAALVHAYVTAGDAEAGEALK